MMPCTIMYAAIAMTRGQAIRWLPSSEVLATIPRNGAKKGSVAARIMEEPRIVRGVDEFEEGRTRRSV